MFGRRGNRKSHAKSLKSDRTRTAAIEALECRTLLSTVTLQPNIIHLGAADSSSSDVQGYTPAQITAAYGFDNISFGSGSAAANGAGQTIALVDAYNDPNIVSDLKTFDTEFNLSAPPSFQVVSQTGSTSQLPSDDAGWSSEISLDVEWAHAVAPDANILLVEADSDSLDDLMTAVNYARHASGVSVVSMSWGGSEFFEWDGGEFVGQTDYDPYFTTPTGHEGVTFVAAAGDSGSFSGVEWPASSPNVLSVGGTSLTLNSDGTYVSESSWDGTSGGYSQVENEPSYQDVAQDSGVRSTPDVSYDGDPNTGFAVYDSVADEGYVGWQEVGGTSAGAPQWAGLIAIADQGRALAGQATLDGATQTLPILYSLYSAPDTTGYSTYTNYFNDVIDQGSSDPWHWRWGYGYNSNSAVAGYDTVTGLGSPKAANLVDALIAGGDSSSGSTSSGSGSSSSGSSGSGSSGSTSSGTGSTGSGSTGSGTTASLPASPLDGTFISSLPTSVIGGTDGTVKLDVTNTLDAKFSGPVTISLYASTDGSASGDAVLLTAVTEQMTLRAGGSKVVRLRFDYPSDSQSGTYYLVASMTALGTDTAAAVVATPATVDVAAPDVDLATTFNDGQAISVTPGGSDTAIITLTNVGNETAVGTFSEDLYASADQTLDSSAALLVAMPSRRIDLRPGKSMTFKVRFVAPADETPGSYYLIASTTSSTTPPDNNALNDTAVIATV